MSTNDGGCERVQAATEATEVAMPNINTANTYTDSWVRESKIGRKFLNSELWFDRVLAIALCDFSKLLSGLEYKSERLLDAGCGAGAAFPLLRKHLAPREIIGIDIDEEQIALGQETYANDDSIRFERSAVANSALAEASIDMVFCHQLLHHTEQQEQALEKFYQLLESGGVLLVAESCKKFINIWWVRWFFRHPYSVQKTAEEYVELIERAGFTQSLHKFH